MSGNRISLAEPQDENLPIHQQSTRHKLMIQAFLPEETRKAGLSNAAQIARQITALKEGTLVATRPGLAISSWRASV